MKRSIALAIAGSALAVATAAAAQRARLPAECRQEIVQLCRGAPAGIRECVRSALPRLSQQCRSAISDRAAASRPLPEGFVEASYGADPKQTLAYQRPVLNRTTPLLVFIHGGGWSIGDKAMSVDAKAAHFTAQGWTFATVNYRLVPNATVEQQAADVAGAVAWLRANAVQRGFEGDRIVLMGHSAGAHLAALVATDPRYLAAAGVPLAAVRGVVLLDGAGYDVARQMAGPGNRVSGIYDAAFGRDPARQRALSPTAHAAAPNAASWLILPVATRADAVAQSQALSAALRAAGARSAVVPVQGENHRTLNRGLGEAGDAATGEIDRFLAALR